MRKTYWCGVSLCGDRDKDALKSWFSPFAKENETPIKADILCDIDTDDERKLKVIFASPDGSHREAIRSKTKKGVTYTFKAIALAANLGPST